MSNKTNKMLKIQKKKCANKSFNDVAFPKQGYYSYIGKYLVVWWKSDLIKERRCEN